MFGLGGAFKYVVALCIIMVALAVISFSRHFGCNKSRDERRRDRIMTYGPFKVKTIDGPCSLTVAAGRRDRKANTVQLDDVVFPHEAAPLRSSAMDALKVACGPSVSVIRTREVRRGQPEMLGEVHGSSGEVQIVLLRAGLLRCDGDAPRDYFTAEKEARKKHRGMWSDKKLHAPEAGRSVLNRLIDATGNLFLAGLAVLVVGILLTGVPKCDKFGRTVFSVGLSAVLLSAASACVLVPIAILDDLFGLWSRF